MTTDQAQATKRDMERRKSQHEDWTERVNSLLYIRFTRGPDYEWAYLCLDDGAADMRDLARMSFTQARLLMAAMAAG